MADMEAEVVSSDKSYDTGGGAPLTLTPTGRLRTDTLAAEGARASYRAVFAASAIDAAGVLSQITGSATKTVKITSIRLTGRLTTGASGQVIVTRNNVTATGGTSTAMAAVPLDSTNAAASAALIAYTAVPTPAANIGNVAAKEVFWAAPTAMGNEACFEFGTRNGQAATLRGVSQFLTIRTLGFAAYTGAAYSLEIEWTEE